MNSRLRKIINEIVRNDSERTPAELEKLVAQFAAHKPKVKSTRRFRKALKERIMGREPWQRRWLRPERLGFAAAAAAAVCIGVIYLGGLDRPGYTAYELGMSDSLSFGWRAPETGGNSDMEHEADKPESVNDKGGDVLKSIEPEGPPAVDKNTAAGYWAATEIKPNSGKVDQTRTAAFKQEMKLYFGFLTLTVKDPEPTRDRIVAYAEKTGGFIETAGAALVVIRVPRAAFTAALAEIALYGEVADKSIETFDVSMAYQDLDLRLKVASAARDRLYRLLEKTTDVKERFAVLHEIQRLTEEVELLAQRLQTLDRLSAYSKITVTLKRRMAAAVSENGSIPFAWVQEAAVGKTADKILHGKIKMELPADFALLEKEKFHYAESSSGVSIAVYSEANQPRGDGDFWRETLAFHLQRQFASAVRLDLGTVKAVVLESHDSDPFYLLVGVRVNGDRITVCKAFFPNAAEYRARKTAVETMITGMEVLP